MRYIAITILCGLIVLVLAPYAQRLWDVGKKWVAGIYDDYDINNKGDKHDSE